MDILANISVPLLLGVDSLFLLYVAAFSLAALGCFAGLLRVKRITDRDVRRGLSALLLTSGGWASAHVGYLAAPTAQLQHLFYVAGLVVGFAAVGPWLYFCSAYSGRSLHRNSAIRTAAVVVFVGIIALKLSNPLHGWYYSTAVVSEPFPHLLVSHGALHWVVLGVAYSLAIVGFFMLFELFLSIDYDVTPLAVLIGVTGLPIATDVAAAVVPAIPELTYSPLGVAVFGVGVMFVYLDLFQQIQLTGDSDEFAIFLDEGEHIRDFSPTACEQFPSLEGSRGQPLASVLPTVAETLDNETAKLELKENGNSRYYHVSESGFTSSEAALGSMVSFTDITERERYRQELERQNTRLEKFASILSHDLRNPLNVATLHLDTLRQNVENEEDDFSAINTAHDRMEEMIEDLLGLAKHGQPIEDMDEVSLSTLARESWDVVETGECDLLVDSEHRFEADGDRGKQLFENLFRNALEHGGAVSTIRVGELDDGRGFYVADDGVGIPEDEREDVLDFGYSTNEDGTGFGLAIVAEIVGAHKWTIDVTAGEDGGARFEITTSVRRQTRQVEARTPSEPESASSTSYTGRRKS